MKQEIEVKVTLLFEAECLINEEGKTELENNIIEALDYWAANTGLCPEQMNGYTVDIRTDME